MKLIGRNCPNLEKLSFQWCMNIDDEGFSFVLMNCKQLVSLDGTGLKNLKDACLDEAIKSEMKNEKTALRKLKYLSFNRCDFVSST